MVLSELYVVVAECQRAIQANQAILDRVDVGVQFGEVFQRLTL